MPSKGNLLTVAEVAKTIGVTEETVRRYIREKKLKAEKKRIQGLKQAWLVAPEEIRRFQEND
jgi:excisionase family DNA binding protein